MIPLRLLLIFIFSLLLLVTGLNAQTTKSADESNSAVVHLNAEDTDLSVQERLANWRGTLSSAEQALTRSGLEDGELADKSAEVSNIGQNALTLEHELLPLVEQIKEQLDELGAAPKEGEPDEAEEIKNKRKELEANFSKYDGELKASRLIAVRSAQLVQQIIKNRRHKFVTQIFQRSYSLFDIQLWDVFFSGFEGFLDRFNLLISDSLDVINTKLAKTNQIVPVLLGGVVFVILIAGMLRQAFLNNIKKTIQSRPDEHLKDHATKVQLGYLSFALNGVLPAALLYAVYLMVASTEIMTVRLENLMQEFTLVVCTAIIAVCLLNVFLRPRMPARRLVGLSNRAALRIRNIIATGIVVIVALELLKKTAEILISPLEVSIGLSALLALVCFICILLLLITVAASTVVQPAKVVIRANIVRWGYLNPLYWIACIGGLICLFSGYIALGEFLATQALIGGMIFSLLWLGIEFLDLHRDRYLDANSGRWQKLSHLTGFSQQTVLQGSVFGFGLAKLATISAAVMLFMISWDYRTGDWAGPVSKAFFGFKIGGLSISLSSVVLAVVLFIGGYIVTKAIQHWSRYQFLPTTALDPGLRNSIATVFGYVGIILAALLAVTAAGLDLSKVAIVAGALSVGIGFGLQSIVNNFVSGLILLAERPIKTGDWIITSGGEGTVRKTSVRSTEIETFDGATVIVPNSTLITDAVTNWTHHDQKGRIIITVGVGYDSDPAQVRDLLLECGQSNERIVSNPAPTVFFSDFGADALIFELRAYLGDINNATSTKSDLRFAIFKALRDANIEIPYPQRDIHIKSASGQIPAVEIAGKPVAREARSRSKAGARTKTGKL